MLNEFILPLWKIMVESGKQGKTTTVTDYETAKRLFGRNI